MSNPQVFGSAVISTTSQTGTLFTGLTGSFNIKLTNDALAKPTVLVLYIDGTDISGTLTVNQYDNITLGPFFVAGEDVTYVAFGYQSHCTITASGIVLT